MANAGRSRTKFCKVAWVKSRFGYDAVGYDGKGRSFNAINYGLKKPPTKRQKMVAELRLCGSGGLGARRKRRR